MGSGVDNSKTVKGNQGSTRRRSPPRGRRHNLRLRLSPRGWLVLLLTVVSISSVIGSLTPVAGASSTAATSTSLTFAPPFSGATPEVGTENLTSGCLSHASLEVRPVAYAATGRIATQLMAWSHGCPLAASDAGAGADMGFSGPSFSVPTSGAYNISFGWNLSWTAFISAVPSSSANYAYAAGQLELVDFVYDEQNATDVGYADSFFWSASESNGTASFLEVGEHEWANTSVSLSAGDVYQLQSNLYAYFDVYTNPGSTALAKFDLATHGTGGQLSEMTVEG